jgi:hypothetical protein
MNRGQQWPLVARVAFREETKIASTPFKTKGFLIFKVVGWQGFEPWTNGLKGRCSTRLSYQPAGRTRTLEEPICRGKKFP